MLLIFIHPQCLVSKQGIFVRLEKKNSFTPLHTSTGQSNRDGLLQEEIYSGVPHTAKLYATCVCLRWRRDQSPHAAKLAGNLGALPAVGGLISVARWSCRLSKDYSKVRRRGAVIDKRVLVSIVAMVLASTTLD